jgi:ribosomal protein L36
MTQKTRAEMTTEEIEETEKEPTEQDKKIGGTNCQFVKRAKRARILTKLQCKSWQLTDLFPKQ